MTADTISFGVSDGHLTKRSVKRNHRAPARKSWQARARWPFCSTHLFGFHIAFLFWIRPTGKRRHSGIQNFGCGWLS